MMKQTREQITLDIGKLILKAANTSSDKWDYAGYVFETMNGVSSSGTKFLYNGSERLSLGLGADQKQISQSFKYLREITRVDGDDYWVACKAVLRQSDGDFQMLFEFDDINRWGINPGNAKKAYDILVKDVFRDA